MKLFLGIFFLAVGSLLFGQTTFRINCGGPSYIDSANNVWSADAFFQGGSTYTSGTRLQSSTDTTLYQSQRFGVSTYSFDLMNGAYNVNLKFAEIYFTSPGQRLFNVAINGYTVLTNFDIFAAAGGRNNVPADKTFPIYVANNKLTIQLLQGNANLPEIQGIEIVPIPQGVPYAGASQDLNLGNFRLIAKNVVTTGNGVYLYLSVAPSAPTSTTDDTGKTYAAVMYLDPADSKLKIRKANGTIVSLEP